MINIAFCYKKSMNVLELILQSVFPVNKRNVLYLYFCAIMLFVWNVSFTLLVSCWYLKLPVPDIDALSIFWYTTLFGKIFSWMRGMKSKLQFRHSTFIVYLIFHNCKKIARVCYFSLGNLTTQCIVINMTIHDKFSILPLNALECAPLPSLNCPTVVCCCNLSKARLRK